MAHGDRDHWDERYAALSEAPNPRPPHHLGALAAYLPASGTAIELACGRGEASVWLARHGLTVTGYDVSPIAIAAAQQLAETNDLADRVSFIVADLDEAPVQSVPVDLLLSHLYLPRFSPFQLEALVAERGIIAIATLSEVDAAPGRFRTARGELLHRFRSFDVIDHNEVNGIAYLIARTTGGQAPPLPSRDEQP